MKAKIITDQTQSKMKDKVADRIVKAVLTVQKRWTLFLNNWMDKQSHKGKKRAVFAFIIVSGGLSVCTVVAPFISKPVPALRISQIKTSEFMTANGDETTRTEVRISEQEYQRARSFHHFLDSLRAFHAGKLKVDSILKTHPGLLDSTMRLVHLYNLQKSKQ
ncbi:MAG: hypothetical protein ABWZ25_08805 [Chitinophagaceae bacterium]